MGSLVGEPEKKFKFVKSTFTDAPTTQIGKDRLNFIPSGGMNDVIKRYHEQVEGRGDLGCSPSGFTKCPRVVWLEKHNVPKTREMTWALKQRLLLGRLFENQFAEELQIDGKLLHHWSDNPGEEVDRFVYGEGLTRFTGVPDYLLKPPVAEVNGTRIECAISDAKTSRGDGFSYVPILMEEAFANNWDWYKYKLQLTGYYMLAHANPDWFASKGLPLPDACHLFSYALDDGLVRREFTWIPTRDDFETVLRYVRRYNSAIAAEQCPECTCNESFGRFSVKFCDYGYMMDGEKVASSCCHDHLMELAV